MWFNKLEHALHEKGSFFTALNKPGTQPSEATTSVYLLEIKWEELDTKEIEKIKISIEKYIFDQEWRDVTLLQKQMLFLLKTGK